MNVLLVCQCDKRALVETRRILDQFAERRGERTWQTPITLAGLDTLRRLLKKTARRNTAVACHWIRGRDHSELLWIVGDASRFNEQGAVPTDTSRRDILRREDENDWHSAEDIRLLAQMAALFHDIGKASDAFQAKLKSRQPLADAYRHEWVSLRLFEAFVGQGVEDTDWLQRLAALETQDNTQWLARLQRDGLDEPPMPFHEGGMPPLAQALGWLILTHHRLPHGQHRGKASLERLPSVIRPDWCGPQAEASMAEKQRCWRFPKGLPFASRAWRSKVAACASTMLAHNGFIARASAFRTDPYVMHLARLALMLADHHYSSQPAKPLGDRDFPLFANTDSDGVAKQRLDEHLIGVARGARQLLGVLPRLERQLPRIARHSGFKRRATAERFRWQDKAFDTAGALNERALRQGFFGVNMASTGCGKTLANARILYALADPRRGMRATIALGLRTLTLQTGQAYRERLGLGDDDLAVLVGGGAVRELFELAQPSLDAQGSESAEPLLPDNSHVSYASNLDDSPLKDWLGGNPAANRLLDAPMLVCTIDHLMPASESLRGGRQIAPMLRLMTSDLILDEPDDFDSDDLPALTRLVHWAGLLGSRVLLSSATLPPALVEGLFEAYRNGREQFQKHRGERPGAAAEIVCAWFDEFHSSAEDCANLDAFAAAHGRVAERRLARLRQSDVRRRASLFTPQLSSRTPQVICTELAQQLPARMLELHNAHHTTLAAKHVSFGLVRLAHIEALITLAQALFAQDAPPGCRLHLCVYHSRHPLLMRNAIENQLDDLLKRSDGDTERLLAKEPVRRALAESPEDHHLFVVLASPVAEVGRDHDYDWAIVEPSSMRSIIQLAGRVRRHRSGACTTPNIQLLAQNLWSLEGRTIAYRQPGFECEAFPLASHDLASLIETPHLQAIDAGPRIVEPQPLRARERLVDLEHARLRALLHGGHPGVPLSTPLWWRTPAPLSGILQHDQRFRAGDKEQRYALLPDADDEQRLNFCLDNPEARWNDPTSRWIPCNNLLAPLDLALGQGVSHWGAGDYRAALERLAERTGQTPEECARRYGQVQLKDSPQGWRYHPALGFKRRR
ncbi:type I-F CRISPR-associated helicase Cas3f [Pseudomonas panipatensis]|uniref:type I-F CRISPR-associated helicase Cas3f n=1 Tax=Pseudomonas panipatensis TaxID=428992 RepID=UPI0035B49A0C